MSLLSPAQVWAENLLDIYRLTVESDPRFHSNQVLTESLLDIYHLAVESDPRFHAAEAGHLAALEAKPRSRAALLPNISLSASSGTYEQTITGSPSEEYDATSYSLSLKQSLYHHDYFIQLRQANASVAKADAEYAAASQSLVLRVAEAYFNLLATNINLAVAGAEKRAIGQQLHQTQQRFEVGLIAITDVHETQARHDAALAQQIVAANQLDTAREGLRELTGREHTYLAVLGANMPLLTPEPENIDEWVNKALEQNLALLAAQATVRGSEAAFKGRRAGHFPTLDIIASQNYSDSTQPIVGNESDTTYIGLQLNMPIYQGGGISSASREARHLYNQAQQQLEQQRRATIRQARAAYLAVMAGISQVKALQQSLSSSEIALKATQAGFDVGTRTTVDVLNSQRELYRAQRDYARARYDYLLASLNLKQAAGILAEVDIEQINNWLE